MSLPGAAAKAASAGSTLKKMKDIHDIRPPVIIGMDMSFIKYLGFALVALVILGVLAWLVIYLKNRKKRDLETLIPSLLPEAEAFQAIKDLEENHIRDHRIFYFTLSEIIRNYIHGRFNIGSLEMTAEELLPKLELLKIDKDLKKRLKGFISFSDPIKFAGKQADENEMKNDIEFAKEFITKTTPGEEDGEDE